MTDQQEVANMLDFFYSLFEIQGPAHFVWFCICVFLLSWLAYATIDSLTENNYTSSEPTDSVWFG